MYHEDVCTAFDDQILDLIDYSYRLLTEIIRKLKHEYEQLFPLYKKKTELNSLANNELVKNNLIKLQIPQIMMLPRISK